MFTGWRGISTGRYSSEGGRDEKETLRAKVTNEEKIRQRVLRVRRQADYNARRRAEKMGRPAVDVSRDDIIARDGQACYLCGRELSIHEVTLDHVTPLSQGGTHTPDNVRLAHGSCNSKKGARRIEVVDLSTF